MGASKTDHFTEEQYSLAILAKAVGHPARVAIIQYLLSVETCICGDIVNVLPLAQPTVSQHLKELKNAGIIKGNIEGNAICYCLNEEAVELLHQFFANVSSKISSKSKSCC
jgi:DNA-binding transcriptional ArsR family regulator